MTAGWIHGVIGAGLLLAQSQLAQEPAAGVGWIDGRNDRFRRQFEELLLGSRNRNVEAGWQLARDLGRPVAPLLWDLLRKETANVERRLVLLAAAVLAGGPGEDERLFAWLERQKPMFQERVLAAMLIALGPRRSRPVEGFWARGAGPARAGDGLLGVALRLAASRFPDAATAAPPLGSEDRGLAAAAAFAGAPIPPPLLLRLQQIRDGDRHADLFWRGALLGALARFDAGPPPAALIERARALAQPPEPLGEGAAAAATMLLARASMLEVQGQRPEWRQLHWIAAQCTDRDLMRGWLGAVPQQRDEQPERLAVAYALYMPVREVIAERAAWLADTRTRRHIAVAFAIRLLQSDPPPAVDVAAAELPEWGFVHWAAGAPFPAAGACADGRLQLLAELCAAGRADRDTARAVLEQTLWQWGSHPGLIRWQQERLLVRDLLLAGSSSGGGKYQPHVRRDQRYLPAGLDRDDEFFAIATALYDFLDKPELPLPREHQLRLPPERGG